jgi:hypothetical protein
MLQRLHVREGQRADDARRQFDAQLGVARWAAPGRGVVGADPRDDGAPWWWDGEEEASSSFLAAMGVSLDG